LPDQWQTLGKSMRRIAAAEAAARTMFAPRSRAPFGRDAEPPPRNALQIGLQQIIDAQA
jgi:hypothetical protein